MNNTLLGLAFYNSSQANIITIADSGKIIAINKSACRLFGYSKKMILTRNISSIFQGEENSLENVMTEKTFNQHKTVSITALKKNGRQAACEVISTVFKDDKGQLCMINVITDRSESLFRQKQIDKSRQKIVSQNIVNEKSKQKKKDIIKDKLVADNILLALAKSEAILAENNIWKKHVGKTLYDVMWDWDIAKGQIYVGDSIEEVFGYAVQNNTVDFKDFIKNIIPQGSHAFEEKLRKAVASNNKSWSDTFFIKRHDGSLASTTCRASIVRNKQGRAIHLIGAIRDISRIEELEKKLEEQITQQHEQMEASLQDQNTSFQSIWDWNLDTDEFLHDEGFHGLFGYPVNNGGDLKSGWKNYIYAGDAAQVETDLNNALESAASSWNCVYRFTRADQSVAKVFNRTSIFRHPGGKAYRITGTMKDISKQKVLEEMLEQEIKIKEFEIAQAIEDAKNTERSEIAQELHDNINQLLFASRMYTEMAKRGGEKSEIYLSRSSDCTLMAIEEIRKLTKGLTTDIIKSLGLCAAIVNITKDTMEANPIKIHCDLGNFKEDAINEKFKLNLYRIVQEQFNNILKHSQATEASVYLVQNKKFIKLTIADNGVGFDTGKKGKGIGILNINNRAAAFNGVAKFISRPGHGCVLTATFSIAKKILSTKVSLKSEK